MDKVEPDGRDTIRGAANSVSSPDLPDFGCMKEQFEAHPYAEWLKTRQTK